MPLIINIHSNDTLVIVFVGVKNNVINYDQKCIKNDFLCNTECVKATVWLTKIYGSERHGVLSIILYLPLNLP